MENPEKKKVEKMLFYLKKEVEMGSIWLESYGLLSAYVLIN